MDIDDPVVIDRCDAIDPTEVLPVRALHGDDPDLLTRVLVKGYGTVAGGECVHPTVARRNTAACPRGAEALRLPLPVGFAGLAIDGDHAPARRVGVDDSIDHDGGGLLPGVVGGRLDGGEVRPPRRAELLEVLLADLRQSRVVLVSQVASDGGHVGPGGVDRGQGVRWALRSWSRYSSPWKGNKRRGQHCAQ